MRKFEKPGTLRPGFLFVWLILAFAFTACSAEQLQPVKKVVDGDTVHLENGEKVRLIGINTPEIGRDGKADQPLAQAARKRLAELIGSGGIAVTPGTESRDNYNRLLAYLRTADGRDPALMLLQEGLAWPVAIAPNLERVDQYFIAASQARTANIGVWKRYPAVAVAKVSEGGFQRISGKVTKITFAKTWWISIENKVVLPVFAEHQHHFSRAEVEQWRGKRVEVLGWVTRNRGNYEPWRLVVNHPGVVLIP